MADRTFQLTKTGFVTGTNTDTFTIPLVSVNWQEGNAYYGFEVNFVYFSALEANSGYSRYLVGAHRGGATTTVTGENLVQEVGTTLSSLAATATGSNILITLTWSNTVDRNWRAYINAYVKDNGTE